MLRSDVNTLNSILKESQNGYFVHQRIYKITPVTNLEYLTWKQSNTILVTRPIKSSSALTVALESGCSVERRRSHRVFVLERRPVYERRRVDGHSWQGLASRERRAPRGGMFVAEQTLGVAYAVVLVVSRIRRSWHTPFEAPGWAVRRDRIGESVVGGSAEVRQSDGPDYVVVGGSATGHPRLIFREEATASTSRMVHGGGGTISLWGRWRTRLLLWLSSAAGGSVCRGRHVHGAAVLLRRRVVPVLSGGRRGRLWRFPLRRMVCPLHLTRSF